MRPYRVCLLVSIRSPRQSPLEFKRLKAWTLCSCLLSYSLTHGKFSKIIRWVVRCGTQVRTCLRHRGCLAVGMNEAMGVRLCGNCNHSFPWLVERKDTGDLQGTAENLGLQCRTSHPRVSQHVSLPGGFCEQEPHNPQALCG